MNRINKADEKDFMNCYKIALVSMFDDKGDLHISLLSSLMNKGEDKMMFGQFIEGESKKYIYRNPKSGLIIMNLNKEFWTGKMNFTHSVTEGEDYIKFNEQPLYRYNSYFGIHRVHYADLIDISEKKKLDMGGIVLNALKVAVLKGFMKGKSEEEPLTPWARKFLGGIGTLMFLAYEDKDGYPVVVPVIQAQASSASRIVLTKKPYAEMLANLKDGSRVAVYGASMNMEAVLVKGVYHEAKVGLAYVDIDTVYNPVPPKHGLIYPRKPVEAVEFD